MHVPAPRWSGPPGPGFRLHLRDGVPHQSRERVPQPAARGPQRAARAEKHAAGDKVSLMDRLIRFCSIVVFIGRHRIAYIVHGCRVERYGWWDYTTWQAVDQSWETRSSGSTCNTKVYMRAKFWKKINEQKHGLTKKVKSVSRYFHFRVK